MSAEALHGGGLRGRRNFEEGFRRLYTTIARPFASSLGPGPPAGLLSPPAGLPDGVVPLQLFDRISKRFFIFVRFGIRITLLSHTHTRFIFFPYLSNAF